MLSQNVAKAFFRFYAKSYLVIFLSVTLAPDLLANVPDFVWKIFFSIILSISEEICSLVRSDFTPLIVMELLEPVEVMKFIVRTYSIKTCPLS